jgi:transcriptional regulator with PAS, ATPase and Fis domain
MDSGTEPKTLSEANEPAVIRRPVLVVVGGVEGAPPADPILPIGPSLTIGRGVDSGEGPHWRPDDRLVSTRHARLAGLPGGAELEDLGSRNGTLVNGLRIGAATRLNDGDLIFLGGQAAVFRLVTDGQLESLREEWARPLGPVPSTSPALAAICQRLRRLARSTAEVLLTGETGVGKEVYARAIHTASGRNGRFLAIDCASLPRELVESELFGFVRGAHSQATRSKPGLLEQAQGGTVLLDEVGEMPSELQAKLLRFLQTKTCTPLGATSPITLDVRVVAATNRSVDRGDGLGLRPDLAARLGAQPAALPPLRRRIEDLLRLAHHLAPGVTLKLAAFRALCLHQWPGNVRELQKVMSEAQLLGGDSSIGLDHLPSGLTTPAPDAPLVVPPSPYPAAPSPSSSRRRSPREAPSRDVLEELLNRHQGNVAEVARELDRKWAVVWRFIVRSGIDMERYRKT